MDDIGWKRGPTDPVRAVDQGDERRRAGAEGGRCAPARDPGRTAPGAPSPALRRRCRRAWTAALVASLLAAAVHAETPEEGDLRLTGGDSANHGRVEIFHDGTWGMVCDDYWDLRDAQVACRQLGLEYAEEAIMQLRREDRMKIWLDDLNCTGSESKLADCSRDSYPFAGNLAWGEHNCSYATEGAGVRCGAGGDVPRMVVSHTAVSLHEEGENSTYGERAHTCIGGSPWRRYNDTATYTIRLEKAPTGNVTVSIESDNPDVTANPTTLTFTTSNWNIIRSVGVTSASDSDRENGTATLAHSASGGGYGGTDGAEDVTVSVTVEDNGPAVEIDGRGLPGAWTREMLEGGNDWCYTVALTGRPTGTVTYSATSSNPDVVTRPPTFTFTPLNWRAARVVRVTTSEDSDRESESATIAHAFSGGGYDAVTFRPLTVNVQDDDISFSVSPTRLTIQRGGKAEYELRANGTPTTWQSVSVWARSTYSNYSGIYVAVKEHGYILARFDRQNWQDPQVMRLTVAPWTDLGTQRVVHESPTMGFVDVERELLVTVVEAFTVSIEDAPANHDGMTAFTFRLAFSEDVDVPPEDMRDHALTVHGGTVMDAQRVDGRSDLWEITVEPSVQTSVSVIVPNGRVCTESGALCNSEGMVLLEEKRLSVSGPMPDPLTARFRNVPASHDGSSVFEFSLHASDDLTISIEDMRDHALTVTGGTVTDVVRDSSNERRAPWWIRILPSGVGDVSVLLPANRACTENGALCTSDGRMLSESVEASISGPAQMQQQAADTEAPSVTVTSDATGPVSREFDVTVTFSEAVTGFEMSDLEVMNGAPVRMLSDADGARYEVTIAPDAGVNGTIAVSVPAGVANDAADNGNTSSGVFGIAAKPALTAEFRAAPSSHDGTSDFTLELHLSEEFPLSFRTLRDRALEVDGGDARRTRRLQKGSNTGWRITIGPDTRGDITVSLPARACGETGAVCTADDRALSEGISWTVPGPDSPPRSISIAAVSGAVSEGAAAAFTLTRTGAVGSTPTVNVSVSENGAMLDGTPPATVTFAFGSATAALTMHTEDDEVAESASVVTAALEAGSGYELATGAVTASVTVADDDAAPVVTDAGPFTVYENTTAVATLAATDRDTAVADLAWSIAGGADAAAFVLGTDGALAFAAAKDFEAPDDANEDGAYEVTVRVTDGANPVGASLDVRLADVDDVAPSLSSATVDGTALTLAFDEALDAGSAPGIGAFAVEVAGISRGVDAVEVAGSDTVLTLVSGVSSGEIVTVGYTMPTGAGAGPLKDATGNPVAGFSGVAVTNATGPVLPVVSIAAEASPVTEGTTVAFTLSRTGGTASALTVAVSVSEAGAVVSGTLGSTVSFPADASTATLSVTTENDTVDEADARVTATVAEGSGYEVAADSASAGVDVYDDDAGANPVQTPTVSTLWSSTLEWTEYNGDWVIALAEDFSSPGWTEDGDRYRVWYFAYGPTVEQLWLRMNSEYHGVSEPGELVLHVGDETVTSNDVLTAFANGRAGIVRDFSAEWTAGERVDVRLTRTESDGVSVAKFSVADAQVQEAEGAELSFAVRLDAAQGTTATVRYATSDVTATAGADYVARSGVVRFAPGEAEKRVTVPVLLDQHNDGGETLRLTLSAPFGATIDDGTATGTIVNTGPVPKAWIARFGRTVAEQVLDAVEGRLTAPRSMRTELRLAGHRVGAPMHPDVQAARERPESRELGARDLLVETSFALTGRRAEDTFGAVWGRGAFTRFEGIEGDLALDGEVVSATLGADVTRSRATVGLAVSHSRGEGGYWNGAHGTGGDVGAGELEATLTGVYPYGRYALDERRSVWAVAGYGAGSLRLLPEGQPSIEVDLGLRMAAAGGRVTVVSAPSGGGMELSAKADALVVRTESEGRSGSGGNLAATDAQATRLRLGVEGAWRGFEPNGGTLVPEFELGLRHDGGDAESGFGADVGAGLGWTDRARGLVADVNARGLLTHADGGFRDRALSGSLGWDARPGSDLGLSLTLRQTVGGSASGGADLLLSRPHLGGLAPEREAYDARRLEARLDYGFPVSGGAFTGTPGVRFELSEEHLEYRVGWRLALVRRVGADFELAIEGRRREERLADRAPERAIVWWAKVRW